jgi:hypothetical protein
MHSGHAGPGPNHTWASVLDVAAGWGGLVVGLRPEVCWTKGGDCQSSCLHWCSEIGEGIERRVASSPSPQPFICFFMRDELTWLGNTWIK